MRLQAVLLVLFLAAGAFLYLLNPGIVLEQKTVQIPGGNSPTLPLVAVILAVSAGVMLLMLVTGTFTESSYDVSRRRLQDRVMVREREIAEMKSKSYDEAAQKIEGLRQEITDKIDSLARLVEERSREMAGSTSGR
jgi:hypothetical protein